VRVRVGNGCLDVLALLELEDLFGCCIHMLEWTHVFFSQPDLRLVSLSGTPFYFQGKTISNRGKSDLANHLFRHNV
jgi:hypothetical protein